MKAIAVVLAVSIAAGRLLAQSGAPTGSRLAFEVVSIKKSPPPTTTPVSSGGVAQPGGRWRATYATVVAMIAAVFPEYAQPGQIVGGPEWIRLERFEIEARSEGEPTRQQMAMMARQLLADRFGFRFHVEKRPLDVYAMVVARVDGLGRALRPAVVDCSDWYAAGAEGRPRPVLPPQPGDRPACGTRTRREELTMRLMIGGATIEQLGDMVGGFIGAGENPRLPIVNRTALSGRYDADLEFRIEMPLTTAPETSVSLFQAMQDQLGLKLERRREPADVMVIDEVKMPDEN